MQDLRFSILLDPYSGNTGSVFVTDGKEEVVDALFFEFDGDGLPYILNESSSVPVYFFAISVLLDFVGLNHKKPISH